MRAGGSPVYRDPDGSDVAVHRGRGAADLRQGPGQVAQPCHPIGELIQGGLARPDPGAGDREVEQPTGSRGWSGSPQWTWEPAQVRKIRLAERDRRRWPPGSQRPRRSTRPVRATPGRPRPTWRGGASGTPRGCVGDHLLRGGWPTGRQRTASGGLLRPGPRPGPRRGGARPSPGSGDGRQLADQAGIRTATSAPGGRRRSTQRPGQSPTEVHQRSGQVMEGGDLRGGRWRCVGLPGADPGDGVIQHVRGLPSQLRVRRCGARSGGVGSCSAGR